MNIEYEEIYDIQGLLGQVGQFHDPGKWKQYIGVDFSLLKSQTSYIGFEFPAKPSTN